MNAEITLFMAFAAGVLSFLSPCVLPLLPSYFSILAGTGFAKTADAKPRLVATAGAFVAGFSAVFVALGMLVNAAFFFMSGISAYINIAAGIIVIILGLNVIFDFLSFMNYEKRPFLKPRFPRAPQRNAARADRLAGTLIAAFVAGAAFAAGWTPCVGPILTGILFMAGQSGKAAAAVFYLLVYSAGMALPFMLAALFFDFFMKRMRPLKSRMAVIRYVSGALLIVIGVMILLGKYSALNGQIQSLVMRYIEWAEGKVFPLGALARFLAWVQSF